MSDVIVSYLMFVWQLLITPLVFWGLAIQRCNNTAPSIRQSLSVGDTFPVVWLSIRAGPDTIFTCGPSAAFRLIPHKHDCPFHSAFFSWLQFSSFTPAENTQPPCIDNATRFKQKTQVFLPSFFFLFWKCDQYIVQEKLLPQKQEYVNFCFTLSVFGKEKKKNFK